MTYENDKLIILDKYRKMSVYELRSEKEKILADYKKSPSYDVKKAGGNRGVTLFKF